MIMKNEYAADIREYIRGLPEEAFAKCGFTKQEVLDNKDFSFDWVWTAYQKDVEEYGCDEEYAKEDALREVLGIGINEREAAGNVFDIPGMIGGSEMTKDEAIKIINGIEEVRGALPEDGNDIEVALIMAKDALKEIQQYRALGTVETLREIAAKGKAYEQVAWERDIAIGQLEEIGCRLGQKMDEVKAAVEKQKAKKIIHINDPRNELVYKCPHCGVEYNRFYNGKPYCMFCGQALEFPEAKTR